MLQVFIRYKLFAKSNQLKSVKSFYKVLFYAVKHLTATIACNTVSTYTYMFLN